MFEIMCKDTSFFLFLQRKNKQIMRRKTRKEVFNEWLSQPYMLVIYRMLVTLMALSISRWMLYLFNQQFFHQLAPGEALALYFSGMRFDLPIVFGINLPVILYYCFPSRRIYNKVGQKVIDILYILLNALAILLNFIDIVCFHFFAKHITIDFIKVLGQSDEVSFGVLKQVFFDYWYLLVIYLLFLSIIIVVARNTPLKPHEKEAPSRWKLRQYISLIVMLLLSAIGLRGGLQAKPVNMQTAMEYTDPQNAPILLNTPFCLITEQDKTISLKSGQPLEALHIHDNLQANRFLSCDSLNRDSLPDNLMLIILKNMGQEMIGYYNPDRRYSLTPFMDSLFAHSLTFNGMSNSRRSNEVLPALLASIPSLMENDFVRSAYADNDFDAFGQRLAKHGYNTIFMHGGKNGVQGFDVFSHRAGFKNYFGRIEYGEDSDYDGQWGIYDGPFLQYAVQTLNRVHEPFATALYTLSSRYPYKVPHDFELPEESYYWTGFEKTVYYTDCALRDFFHAASKMKWYDHTLFVITADCSNSEHFLSRYCNVWGMYSIPIVFYHPNKIEPKRCEEIAQQIDLGPSILSALQVNDTLFSFGRNLFDTLSEPAFISYFNLTYQYCDGNYLVQSDGENSFGIYKPMIDPELKDNLIDLLQCPDIFEKLHGFLSDYYNRMINNELYYSPTDTIIQNDSIHETQE